MRPSLLWIQSPVDASFPAGPPSFHPHAMPEATPHSLRRRGIQARWIPFQIALVLASMGPVAGCSGFAPWKQSDKAARNAELYGPTANQRIKALQQQAKAAKATGQAASVDFTQELIGKVLAEHDARVRCELVTLAAEFDTAAAAAICKGAMQDPDERVRMRACDEWRKRGGSEAVELLAQRYRTDRELDVRLRALRMLGELENEAAIPVLAERSRTRIRPCSTGPSSRSSRSAAGTSATTSTPGGSGRPIRTPNSPGRSRRPSASSSDACGRRPARAFLQTVTFRRTGRSAGSVPGPDSGAMIAAPNRPIPRAMS